MKHTTISPHFVIKYNAHRPPNSSGIIHIRVHRAIINPTNPSAPAAAPESAPLVATGAPPALLELLVGPASALLASLTTLLAPFTAWLPTLLAPETAALPTLLAPETATLPTLLAPLTPLLPTLLAPDTPAPTADVMVDPAESVKVVYLEDAWEMAEVMVEPAESVKVLYLLLAPEALAATSEVTVFPAESVTVVVKEPVFGTPLVVKLLVTVFPSESVVVTGITTGTRGAPPVAVAAASVMPLRSWLIPASKEANCTAYSEGTADLNQSGVLEARRAE